MFNHVTSPQSTNEVAPATSSSGSSNGAEQVIDLTEHAADHDVNTSTSSSTLVDTTADEIVLDFINPNKIRRTIPLRLKAHDPAQCFDMLDDMYAIYYDQEVRLVLFLVCYCWVGGISFLQIIQLFC